MKLSITTVVAFAAGIATGGAAGYSALQSAAVERDVSERTICEQRVNDTTEADPLLSTVLPDLAKKPGAWRVTFSKGTTYNPARVITAHGVSEPVAAPTDATVGALPECYDNILGDCIAEGPWDVRYSQGEGGKLRRISQLCWRASVVRSVAADVAAKEPVAKPIGEVEIAP